jgi:signal transduction histidine kinase
MRDKKKEMEQFIGMIMEKKKCIKSILFDNTLAIFFKGKLDVYKSGSVPGSYSCTHFPYSDEDGISIIRKLMKRDKESEIHFPIKVMKPMFPPGDEDRDPMITMIGEAFAEKFLELENATDHERERNSKEFIDMFSHDIGLPLTSLKGNIELMLEGEFGDISEEQNRVLKIMESRVDVINSLRKEALLLNKLDSDEYRIKKTFTSIYNLLQDVQYLIQPISEKKHQTITLNSPHFSAYVDEEKLRQALDNLISNAIKYTPEGGKIDISAEKGDDTFRILIKDTGIGIQEGMEEKIFNRFVRLNKSMAQGTGLGLSIVKMIVEKHGGKTWYESPAEGGSIFIVELPRQ